LSNTFDPERGAPDRFISQATSQHSLRIGEYNGLALVDGVAYADWTGNTATGQQIYFDKFTVPAAGALQVVSTSPSFPGGLFTLGPTFTYDVNFNQAVDPTSVLTSDLSLTGIPGLTVTAVSLLNGNTTVHFTITASASATQGTLSAEIAAGSILDTSSNPNTRFFASYPVDAAATTAYPTPLTAKNPLGSLIYDPSQSGVINFIGDHFRDL
jgi:hypothetical protein